MAGRPRPRLFPSRILIPSPSAPAGRAADDASTAIWPDRHVSKQIRSQKISALLIRTEMYEP